MGEAKRIVLRPINSADAIRVVKTWHYSHKVVNNSQLHVGVFLDGSLEGALQFGPSLDKRKIQGLVEGTPWNGFLELNRMAFSPRLPRNSESRALAICMKLIRRHLPDIQWIVSFADGTQSGDGAIYRASGFVLTAIKRNNQIWEAPNGEVFTDTSIRPGIGGEKTRARAAQIFSRTSLTDGRSKQQQQQAATILSRTTATKGSNILNTGASSMRAFKEAGWKPKAGFQLRYVFFLDPTARERLTVPVVPFDEIQKRGAGMYLGKPRAGSIGADAAAAQAAEGGSNPTPALHSTEGQTDSRPSAPTPEQGSTGTGPGL